MVPRQIKGFFRKPLCLLALSVFSSILSAQQPENYRYAVGIHTDNDAFVAWENKDRYYSFGLGGSFSFKPEHFLGVQDWFSGKEDFFLTGQLRIEGYTPTDKVVSATQLAGDSTIVFDRPFAGLFYGTLEGTHTMKRSFVRTSFLLGIMGPSSGAGRLQRWIHDNVTEDGVFDAWRFQLPDQLLINVSGKYVYDFTPEGTWADIYGGWQARLGNLYIDTTPTIGLRIGRFNSLGKSVALGNALLGGSADWELYLHSSFSATWALYNATAQGRLFGSDYEYALEEINPLFLSMTHGIYFAYRRWALGFDHFFSYGEVVKGERHIYARFDLKYRW